MTTDKQNVDERVQSLVNRAMVKSGGDMGLFNEALVKETVQECMKQIAMPIELSDAVAMATVKLMWDHLAVRYSI